MFFCLGLAALAAGAIIAVRFGLKAWRCYETKLDTWSEFKVFCFNVARGLAGVGILLLGLKALIWSLVMLAMVTLVTPAHAEGNDIRHPVAVGHVHNAKVARHIASRPNVIADQAVRVHARPLVIVLRGMWGYLPIGGFDVLARKIEAKGYQVIVSAPDFYASFAHLRPVMIVGCSLGGTNALELARLVSSKPKVITVDPTRGNRGAPKGVAVMNLHNPGNILGSASVRGAANYRNNLDHIPMCSAEAVHDVILAQL